MVMIAVTMKTNSTHNDDDLDFADYVDDGDYDKYYADYVDNDEWWWW